MAVDVTKMIEPAKQLVEPFTATLGDAWAAVIGDRVAAWRLKNAAALQIKVNEEVAKLGLKLDRPKIPERYAFAWFDEATKQDQPEIQDLFARLLAKAAAGEKGALDRRHLEIITRFHANGRAGVRGNLRTSANRRSTLVGQIRALESTEGRDGGRYRTLTGAPYRARTFGANSRYRSHRPRAHR